MTDSPDERLIAVVVEDDPDIRALLIELFDAAGFRTIPVDNGLDGVEAVRIHQPLVTTLDVNMPGIDGFEAARRIRKYSTTYIIMLSAFGTEADIVLGLGAGADEYVVKPFRPREMRARIEAMLRRPRLERPPTSTDATEDAVAPTPASTPGTRHPLPSAAAVASSTAPLRDENHWVSHHDLRVNPATRTVLVVDREVELTRTEFDLLATLVESKRRVRSKADLTLVLRGEEQATSYYVGEADKRAVEAHMANLRRKLSDNPTEPRYIETVRGVGYRLTP
ncbi:two-component system response regulator [Microbacterium sp. Root61]|uniref:response regulator transcription factor n=1 Tax=Microbacterium sp. Root61 TaxID=1736570 RepID=UPI0006F35A9D|nr:response regulator transcription factor [Microbacterium sp. Root61]KRA25693.1 two-component system response regulator [Microbacterium sp. Root61]